MKAQRINTRPGQALEIVAPFDSPAMWRLAQLAATSLGRLLRCNVIIERAL